MNAWTSYAHSRLPLRYRFLFMLLEKAHNGSLTLDLPDGNRLCFQGDLPGPDAEIRLYDWQAIDRGVLEGDIGFGETYMEGLWDTSDLPVVLRYFTENVATIERLLHGNMFYRMLFGMRSMFRPNTRKGSQKNIYAHYDLGNDFYKLWLDETMTYSSAVYATNHSLPLEQAQTAKYERILSRLSTEGDRRVLEVGCGWGGFCERAARDGWHVTGLTISPSQAEFAVNRLGAQELAGKALIDLRDYRDAQGKFDNLVSIEMFEAVGERFWGQYFQTIAGSLKQHGRALIQTITIADDVFQDYRKRGDFIQRHVFPGGMLPSDRAFREYAAKAGLIVRDAFAFGHDYHRTLGEWLKRFDDVREQVSALGFDEKFIRKWRFYLAYCMAGFGSGRTDVVQYELAFADSRGAA